jgi:hypothetical protein
MQQGSENQHNYAVWYKCHIRLRKQSTNLNVYYWKDHHINRWLWVVFKLLFTFASSLLLYIIYTSYKNQILKISETFSRWGLFCSMYQVPRSCVCVTCDSDFETYVNLLLMTKLHFIIMYFKITASIKIE